MKCEYGVEIKAYIICIYMKEIKISKIEKKGEKGTCMWSSSVTGSEVLVDLSAILFFLTVSRDAGLEKSSIKHQIYKCQLFIQNIQEQKLY